jgi:hypothetical protein
MATPFREAGREVRRVLHAATPAHQHLRERLVVLWVVTFALDLVASGVILAFERGATPTGIRTYGDALFWTTTQLLTVSSQLPNPSSVPGRAVDVLLQAYAISVVAMLAGSFGAFFHRRGLERDPLTPAGDQGAAASGSSSAPR